MLTGGAICADLDGVFGAGKDGIDGVVSKSGEVFSDEIGVVETASADVTTDGGQWNDISRSIKIRESMIHDVGEGASESSNGVIFVIVNEGGEKSGAFAANEGGRKIGAIGTEGGGFD